jgi:hypothetical protein
MKDKRHFSETKNDEACPTFDFIWEKTSHLEIFWIVL